MATTIDGRTLRRGARKPPKDKWAAYYHRQVAKGLCPRCSNPPEAEFVLCNECRKKKKAIYRRQCNRVKLPKRRREPDVLAARLRNALSEPGAIGRGLLYDPQSGSAEECWDRIEDRRAEESGFPTSKEIALYRAAFVVARTDARGREAPGVVFVDQKIATSVLLPHFAAGDQGERYVVTAYDPVTELRFLYGWTDCPGALVRAIRQHPRFRYPWLLERRDSYTILLKR